MANNIDTIKARVRKLLNLAADQEGTPEADAALNRACDLMARYGFEQRDLDAPDEGDEVVSRIYKFTGSYTDMQATLLCHLAEGLHCTALRSGVPHSTKIRGAIVFGLKRHMDRIDMLYTLLKPQMLVLANKHKPHINSINTSAVVRKRSFMRGFAVAMQHRLTEAENTAHEGNTRYAVALVDDAARGDAAKNDWLRKMNAKVIEHRNTHQFDAYSYSGGADTAKNQDIGQTRVNRTPALPA